MQKILFCLLLLCIAYSGGAQITAIDSIVNNAMDKEHIVGMSLGIVKDGKIYLSKGYGYTNLEKTATTNDNTVYKIGSLSKQFIAAAIMILSSEGKLHLSDKVTKYFKGAPATWNNMTIHMLLNHTAGLERESRVVSLTKQQPDSFVVQSAYYDTLLTVPGSKWAYSNLGYFLLADIIRKASEQSFEDYMNNMFASFGMSNTITVDKSKSPNKSKGYRYDYAKEKNIEIPDYQVVRPSGAFSSNIIDLFKWDSLQKDKSLLRKYDWPLEWEDSFRISKLSDAAMYYGYGWFMRKLNNHQLVFHGGNASGGGFTTTYWKFINDDISIIILANATEVSLDKLAGKIAVALNPDYKVQQTAVLNIESYLGVYANSAIKMKIAITNEDGQLVAQATGQSSFTLKNTGKDVFKFDAANIEMDFDVPGKNFTLKQQGVSVVFTKEK